MKLKVVTTDGVDTYSNHYYTVRDGVLRTYRDELSKTPVKVYSPHFWLSIEPSTA